MKFSEERVNALTHKIIHTLRDEDLARYPDQTAALVAAKKVLTDIVHQEDTIDAKARAKIASLKRHVPEGSREWEVLYAQYAAEEWRKFGA